MNGNRKWEKAKGVLETTAERLALLSFIEISQWPEYPQIPDVDLNIPGDYTDITFTLMKDTLPNGTVRVAIQMYKHHFLGIGSMTASGFFIDANSSICWLKEEDIWELT